MKKQENPSKEIKIKFLENQQDSNVKTDNHLNFIELQGKGVNEIKRM